MKILGLSAYYHDSAAALIIDGEILYAAQEERFSRIKNDSAFPVNAIKYCLKSAGLDITEIDIVAYYDKPFLTFERSIETFIAEAPFGFLSYIKSISNLVKKRLLLKNIIQNELFKMNSGLDGLGKRKIRNSLRFTEHHLSHAASAFYPSPYEKALVVTIDGVGEWATTTVAVGNGNQLDIKKEIHFPHSIGLLYSAFTYYLGFKVNSGEYKVMGLAPYGEDKYSNTIKEHLINILDDGSFNLNLEYFSFTRTNRMINNKFELLFQESRRLPESKLSQFHFDIAKSIQAVIEEIILKICSSLSKEYDIKNLCLAGGVALNCVANGKVLDSNLFDNIWIQPAAGDAGGAIGTALAAYYQGLKSPRGLNTNNLDKMHGALLGPEYEASEVRDFLNSRNINYTEYDSKETLNKDVASFISNQRIIGWHQGRMEFGPRSLGNRSILADPRSKSMQVDLNLKIKFRESFRPFAPSILEEYVSDYFDTKQKSPYMLFVSKLNKTKLLELTNSEKSAKGLSMLNIARSVVPAITHVDNTARIQTVSSSVNPIFHSLIKEFYNQTGCPLLVNTSFNVRGEPIVCTPLDSVNCFMNTGIDILVINNFLIKKDEQSPEIVYDIINFDKD